MKRVSVVILNWNGEKLLKTFLPSVIRHTNTELADIIVADNGSTDNSVSFLQINYPTVSILKLGKNYGFAEGYNKALSQIDSEYTVLLNSDVEVTLNWLEPLVNFLDKTSDTVAVQPQILAQLRKSYFEYAGACGGFIDRYGYPFCRGRIFGSVEQDKGQYDSPMQLFWATGACMLIRTNEYKNVGGLDASFFAHMEEIDLCWRLNARGKKVYCIPQSSVYHLGGGTLHEESPRKTFLNFRNNLLMLYKNLNDKEFRHIYRIRTVLDYLAIIQLLIKGKTSNVKSILAARKEFKKIKNNYTQTRDNNLNNETNMHIATIYPKSLIWQYYVKRKKTFSKLTW
ncbi:MAG: hypothetical protein RL662_719 [Bacteroidota bacterium]|jgi:GT2 family glycosyltransferase